MSKERPIPVPVPLAGTPLYGGPYLKIYQIANRLRSYVQLSCMRLQLVWLDMIVVVEMRMQRIKI